MLILPVVLCGLQAVQVKSPDAVGAFLFEIPRRRRDLKGFSSSVVPQGYTHGAGKSAEVA